MKNPMSTKANKETRSAASRSRIVQVAKSRVESSLQSQSSDNDVVPYVHSDVRSAP